MKKIDLLNLIEGNIRTYRLDANDSLRRNSHMNAEIMEGRENIPQEVVDALLVDFINYIGVWQGLDYGMYTRDLNKTFISRSEKWLKKIELGVNILSQI